ncbi:MAG TPA: hypothetical protein VNO79_04930 [Actinomycetota bacterium]|nr:hypothetical protein [Actinomycetota bacterium]
MGDWNVPSEIDWFKHELARLHVDVQHQLKRWRRVAPLLWKHYREEGGSREEAAGLHLAVENATHHLLVAVRDIEKIVLAVEKHLDDDKTKRELAGLRMRYEREAGPARHFRDFYEHAADYILGRGRLRNVLWPRGVQVSFGRDGVVYSAPQAGSAASLILSPEAAGLAALGLAEGVLQVLRRPASDRSEP